MLTPNIDLQNKTILITGAAGFIGANLVMELLRDTDAVKIVGLDSMSDYYDVSIKEYRLAGIDKIAKQKNDSQWMFVKGSIADRSLLERLFQEHCFDLVVNLAAQAGVRYSITNPDAYIECNLVGFYNILEACRRHPVAHLVYASSSSVYGTNRKVPYAVEDQVDNPVSLYAATKKSNELMAHAYSKLYNIPYENGKEGKLIGQNMFMRTSIKADDGRKIPIMTMGPICIKNEYKRKGYGKILLDYSLEKAEELGCGALCFEGNIDFYGKSGFRQASEYGIRYHGLPEGEDASFFLCKELVQGYLDGITGEYATPEGYLVDEREAEEFDKQFS